MSITLFTGDLSPFKSSLVVGKMRRFRGIKGLVTGSSSGGYSPINLSFNSPSVSWVSGRTGFSSAYATNEWLMQEETAGSYSNNVGSATLDNTSGGLTAQSAIGLWDGSSYTTRNVWEGLETGGSRLVCSDSSVGNPAGADICVRVALKINKHAASDAIVSKRDATAGVPGWSLTLSSGGVPVLGIYDGSNTLSFNLTSSISDGAWHYVTFWFDESTGNAYMKSDLDGESMSASSVSSPTATNTLSINALFPTHTSSGCSQQIAYVGLCVGSNAKAMYDEVFWQHATIQGVQVLRSSPVSHVIGVGDSGDYVATFSANTVPIVYNANLSSINKLGLLSTGTRRNYVKFSENLDVSYWVKGGGIGVTPNSVTAPDGFKTGHTLTKDIGAQYSNLYALTDEDLIAGKVYTFSFWFYHIDGLAVQCSIRNESDTSFLGIKKIVDFESGKWTRVSVPFVAAANEKALIRLRPSEGGVDEQASVAFWGVEVKENDAVSSFEPGEYIRTDGAAQSVSPSFISSPSSKISSAIGDLTVKYIPYRAQESYLLVPEGEDSTTNFVNIRNTFDNGTLVSVDWDGDISEEDYFHEDFAVIGEENTVRLVYNYPSGVSESESILYVNGIRNNGGAVPFESVIEPQESTDVHFGSNGTDTNMFGIINSFTFRGENLSLTDDVDRDIVGVDLWTTKQEIDFSTSDVGDLGLWKIEDFTVGWARDPALAGKNGNVYELTCPTTTASGGEISTISSSYRYGSYRAVIKTAPVYGAVSAFFFFGSDTDEIDIEILSRENAQGIAHFVVHENTGDTHKYVPLGFDPSADFHEYRIDFRETSAELWVDNVKRTEITENMPSGDGSIVLNCWNTDEPSWADGPPSEDTVMQIRSISLYTDLPAFISGESTNTTSVSLTIDKPTGVVEGDTLIAFVGCDSDAGNFTGAPEGWNLMGSELIEVDGDGTGPQIDNLHLRSYIKIATSSEPASYSWSRGDPNSAIGWIGAYKGNIVSQPDASAIEAISADSNTNSQSAISTISNNSDVVYAWLIRRVEDVDYLPSSAPTGMTERLNTTASPSNWGIGLCVYDERILVAGNIGTRTLVTPATVGSVGAKVVIKPK